MIDIQTYLSRQGRIIKKKLMLFFALCITLASVFSCKTDLDEPVDPNDGNTELVISAVISDWTSVKTMHDGAGGNVNHGFTLKWEKGDKIIGYYNNGTGDVQMTVKGEFDYVKAERDGNGAIYIEWCKEKYPELATIHYGRIYGFAESMLGQMIDITSPAWSNIYVGFMHITNPEAASWEDWESINFSSENILNGAIQLTRNSSPQAQSTRNSGGEQEGVAKGYNPRYRGRKSHYPLFFY